MRDNRPIEEGCDCPACLNFSRGAIRHFFFASELLGPILVSLHNVWFYQRFMADIRRAIGEGRFAQFMASDPRCRVAPAAQMAAEAMDESDGEQTPPSKEMP